MGLTAVRLPGYPLRLTAIQHVGPIRIGGSGAQVYKVAENNEKWVVKLRGGGQGIRVLFNDYVAGRLGELIGVPFGEHALVEVDDFLLPPEGEQNIRQRLPGTQAGTLYYEFGQSDSQQLRLARNFPEFPSVVVFDTFISLADGRQHLLYPSSGENVGQRDMAAVFDQGYAFTGSPNWDPQSLNNANNCVAADTLGLKAEFPALNLYEPYLRCVEAISRRVLTDIVHESPLREWQVTVPEAEALIAWLERRKNLVRPAIQNYLR